MLFHDLAILPTCSATSANFTHNGGDPLISTWPMGALRSDDLRTSLDSRLFTALYMSRNQRVHRSSLVFRFESGDLRHSEEEVFGLSLSRSSSVDCHKAGFTFPRRSQLVHSTSDQIGRRRREIGDAMPHLIVTRCLLLRPSM